MSSLPNDISKCTGTNCPKKNNCLRFVGEHTDANQSSYFSPNTCIVKIEDGDSLEFEFRMILEVG